MQDEVNPKPDTKEPNRGIVIVGAGGEAGAYLEAYLMHMQNPQPDAAMIIIDTLPLLEQQTPAPVAISPLTLEYDIKYVEHPTIPLTGKELRRERRKKERVKNKKK